VGTPELELFWDKGPLNTGGGRSKRVGRKGCRGETKGLWPMRPLGHNKNLQRKEGRLNRQGTEKPFVKEERGGNNENRHQGKKPGKGEDNQPPTVWRKAHRVGSKRVSE